MNSSSTFPEIERHPLPPFLPENARILILGSFPPQKKRWSMDFFYPNRSNDFWRIMGFIFYQNKEYFLTEDKKAFEKERLVKFLVEKGIALYDTATAIRRLQDNASDKFLEIVEPTDVASLLAQVPDCRAVVTTGQKAMDTLRVQFPIAEPRVGCFSEWEQDGRILRFYRMPSSSRAYPKPIEEKAIHYERMFQEVGILKH